MSASHAPILVAWGVRTLDGMLRGARTLGRNASHVNNAILRS